VDVNEQAITLKAVVARLLRDVADLQGRVEKLEAERDNTLTGSIDGLDDVTLRVQFQTPDEHATAKALRWGKATATHRGGLGGTDESTRTA
jgi:hypothetical protein